MTAGFTITDPADNRVQAVFLRGHLKLLRLGMKHRSLTLTDAMRRAGAITGKKYKRGQSLQALTDLETFIQESKE